MGKGTNQIADELEAKTIGGGSAVSVDLKQVTKSKALEFGCSVQGSYYSNQCTKYSDLKKNVVVKSYKIQQDSSITSVSGQTKISTTTGGSQGTLANGSDYIEIQAGKEVIVNVSAAGYVCNIINIIYGSTMQNIYNGQSFVMPESDVIIAADLSKSGKAIYVGTDSGCRAVVIEEYASGGSVQHTVDINKTSLIPAKNNSFISVFCVPDTGNAFDSIVCGSDKTTQNLYTTTFYGDYDITIEVNSKPCDVYNGECAGDTSFADIVFYSIANSPAERDSRYISETSTPRNVSQCAAEMGRVLFDETSIEDEFAGRSIADEIINPPQYAGNFTDWTEHSIDMCQPNIDVSFKIKNHTGTGEETLIIKPYCMQSSFEPVYTDDESFEYNIVIGRSAVIEKGSFLGGYYSKLYYVSDPCTNTVLCRLMMNMENPSGWMSSDHVITSLQFIVQNLDTNGIWIDFNYVGQNFNDNTHSFLPEYAHYCTPDYNKINTFGQQTPKIFTELELSDEIKYSLGTTGVYNGFTHGGHTNVDGSMYNYPIVGTGLGLLAQWHIQIPKLMLDIAKSENCGCIVMTMLESSPFDSNSIKDFNLTNPGTLEFFREDLESYAPAFPNISQYFSCCAGLLHDAVNGMVLPLAELERLCDCLPAMFSMEDDGSYLHLTINFESACNNNYFAYNLDNIVSMIEMHPLLLSITFLHQTTYFISSCATVFFSDKDRMHPLYYLGDSSATSYTYKISDEMGARQVLACMMNN